ncbi:MAG: hypothetical protein ACKO4U_12620, partial [Caldilinea sp.]
QGAAHPKCQVEGAGDSVAGPFGQTTNRRGGAVAPPLRCRTDGCAARGVADRQSGYGSENAVLYTRNSGRSNQPF